MPHLGVFPTKMKTNQVHLEEKVIVGTEEVQDVDPHFFAIPLPIIFSSLPPKPSEQQSPKSSKASFPSFVHDFSTPNELAQSTMQDEQVRQNFLRKLLKRLTSKTNASNNKVSKLTGKTVLEESIERLRDLHLLHYLQTYLSSSAMSELCGFILDKGSGNPLPIALQVELNMLLQSLEMSCDVDEE